MTDLFATLSPTGAPLYLANLPNVKGKGRPYHEYARNEAELRRFISSYDRDGRALYFTVAKLKDGASRSKENVQSVSWIWSEIDFKDHPTLTPEEIRKRIDAMPYPPTMVIASGHGLHLYWKLNEPIDAAPGKAQQDVEDALKLACAYVGGDTQAAEAARLLRLPGSHNSKEGDNIPVSILADNNCSYEVSDLVDFWLEAQPILPEPVKTTVKTNGHDHCAENDFGDDDAPVDVEARLHSMKFKGSGLSSIHITQLQCTASLLRSGICVTEVVDDVLTATQRCVADDPAVANWNWTDEKRDIRKMCFAFIRKNPELAVLLPDNTFPAWQTSLRAGEQVSASDNVIPIRRIITIAAAPFVPFDPITLAVREWMYGKHYLRGVCTATVGPGGGGKSSLSLTELIAMCTGRNLLGEQPPERYRAWYHNAEEPLVEIKRRIAALCQHYDIPQSDLVGWLFITSGIEMPIKIATSHSGKLTIDAAAAASIIQTITANEIDVVCFDPLVAHHTAAENITGDMDQIFREFARIANATGCCIEVVHHTRKPAPGQEELGVVDSRGAGAIKDAVRSMRVLNPMTKTEATRLNIDDVDRQLYFRVDRGKANYTPPSAARWRKIVGIDIPNGDNVGVVTEWIYPADTTVDVPDVICSQIQVEVSKREYRAAIQSPQWIGILVGRILKVDLSTKAGKSNVGRQLAALYNKGVITTTDGSTGRHPVTIVVVGAWRPPS